MIYDYKVSIYMYDIVPYNALVYKLTILDFLPFIRQEKINFQILIRNLKQNEADVRFVLYCAGTCFTKKLYVFKALLLILKPFPFQYIILVVTL